MKETITGASAHFCEDCIHKTVCRFVSEVQRHEGKVPIFSAPHGPTISITVQCPDKETTHF